MGFTLRLVTADPPKPLPPRFWTAIRDLVREVEYLAVVWDGTLEQDIILQMCKRVAADFGLDPNAGDVTARLQLKSAKRGTTYTPPAGGYMNTVKEKTTYCSTITFVLPQNVRIVVRIEPDAKGFASTTCPNCGKPITNKNPAVAHNIIPQQIWHQIIDAVFKQFLDNVESGALVKKYNLKSYTTESNQKSGDKLDTLLFNLNHPNCVKVLNLFNAPKLIMSSYAAADNVGKQCLECEGVQANASLLQRYELVKAGKMRPILDEKKVPMDVFIGRQLLCSPVTTKEMLRQVTRRQIGRFLLGIEKIVDDQFSGGQILPLLALMIDHWEEFVWTFRTVALAKCDVPYEGNLNTKHAIAWS